MCLLEGTKIWGHCDMGSGIYQIRNRMNGKRYIGSARNLRHRWQDHLSALRRRQHGNRHLQRAFGKHGEQAFEFTVLEHIEDVLQLIEREQHFLDTLNPEYNIALVARSPMLGRHHTPEARAKMSEVWMGHPVSVEVRAKMSEAKRGERNPFYGKHLSEEHRGKISEALKGRPCSEETRQKIGEASRNRSIESNRKISIAMSGERNPMYGMSGERNSMYGKHHSEETRKKISMAQKARWRRIHAENRNT